MKKIIILLFMCFSIKSNAQLTASVIVKSVTDSVIMGDTIEIHFVANFAYNDYARLQLWTPIYLQDCMYSHYTTVYGLSKDSNNYYIKKVKIIPAMGYGNARIYSNSTPSPGYLPFYIKHDDVGIREIDKTNSQNIEYYDLMGNKIDKKPNELIIEKSGNYRRKVIIIE